MLPEDHQRFHDTFFELDIFQGNTLLKKDIKEQICHIFLEFYIDKERNQIQKNL